MPAVCHHLAGVFAWQSGNAYDIQWYYTGAVTPANMTIRIQEIKSGGNVRSYYYPIGTNTYGINDYLCPGVPKVRKPERQAVNYILSLVSGTFCRVYSCELNCL